MWRVLSNAKRELTGRSNVNESVDLASFASLGCYQCCFFFFKSPALGELQSCIYHSINTH